MFWGSKAVGEELEVLWGFRGFLGFGALGVFGVQGLGFRALGGF